MSDLLSNFRSKVSKMKVAGINNVAEFDVMYPTGFLGLDYLNGTKVYVDSPDRKFSYNSIGILDGSTNTIIGRSNSGKSSLLIQICANIIRPFPNAKLFIDDIEGSLPMSRKEFLLGMTPEELSFKVDMRNSGITTENVFKRIQTIHDIKTSERDEYEYDTGLYDIYGNRIFKFIPTVYVIDSLPMLLPESLAADNELGSSMDASAIAKSNTMLTKKISQLCKEANIIVFAVNHILDDIQMGFIPKASQISGLKQGERLPGGKSSLYLANNMFRLDDSQTLKDSEGYGINGSIVNVTLIKSRSNTTKRSVPLIFNKTEGKFDEILSLCQLLKQEGKFGGAGQYLTLDGAPGVKFSLRNIKKVLNESPEFQKAFAQNCYDILVSYLSTTRAQSGENTMAVSITDMINKLASPENQQQ